MCAIFVLSGAVNLGFSGPSMALPFLLGLGAITWRHRWFRAAAGVALAAALLLLAQSLWPSMYFRHLGDELVLVEAACVLANSPNHPPYLHAQRDCSKANGGTRPALGTLQAGRYRIVGVDISHPDFGLSVDYVIDTPFGQILASEGLARLAHSDGTPLVRNDPARTWWQAASVLMVWPLLLAGPGFLLSLLA